MAGEQRSTEIVILSEQQGLGHHVTEILTLSEMGALGLYVTELGILAELGALGLRVSELSVLSEMEDVIIDGYAVGIGHDLPIAFIHSIVPQFTTKGVKVTRRPFSHNRRFQDEFLYVEFMFSSVGTRTNYRNLLAQFDLINNQERNVTVYVRDKVLRWRRANGVAVRPLQNEDIKYNFFPQEITILIKELEFLD